MDHTNSRITAVVIISKKVSHHKFVLAVSISSIAWRLFEFNNHRRPEIQNARGRRDDLRRTWFRDIGKRRDHLIIRITEIKNFLSHVGAML